MRRFTLSSSDGLDIRHPRRQESLWPIAIRQALLLWHIVEAHEADMRDLHATKPGSTATRSEAIDSEQVWQHTND
jgi:hypothetical protein